MESKWIRIKDLLGAETRIEVPVTLRRDSTELLALHPFIRKQILRHFDKSGDTARLKRHLR